MTHRAIIRIVPVGKTNLHINYGRRMYAIIRRYTPEALEVDKNECYAELTGLRTFFKMSYQEIAEKIINELENELGIRFRVRVATATEFSKATLFAKKSKSISTYSEINSLFAKKLFIDSSASRSTHRIKRVKLTIPFIGKVH